MTQAATPSNAELAARMQKIIFAVEDVREDVRATDKAIEGLDGQYSEVLDRVVDVVDCQTAKLNEVVGKVNELTGALNEMTSAVGKLVDALGKRRR